MTLFISPTGTKYKLNNRRDVIYEVLQDTGYFEQLLIEIASEHLTLRPGLVIDVGANIGTVCIELSTRFPQCQFHAFEPVTLAYNELKYNIALNNYTNIQTYNLALSDYAGELVGEDPSDIQPYGHISLLPEIDDLRNCKPNNTTTYNAVTLDSFNFQDVSFIKIDVEGMEYEVITGALDTIERCKPMIMFEAWNLDWFTEHRNKLINLVKSIGYSKLFIDGDNIIASI